MLILTSNPSKRRELSESCSPFSNFVAAMPDLGPRISTRHMDRAEVLHALSYDIGLSWKNATGDFNYVLRCENLTFPKLTARGKPSTTVPAGNDS